MILPDDGLSDSKFGSSSTNLPTHTQNNIHHRSASPSLPDYETSEAQHNPQRSRRAKRSVARRFLRAACIVLSIYVGLVFIFGFRFYITVSLIQQSGMPIASILIRF